MAAVRINTLIVEDDQGLRSSLKKSFQRKDYHVLAVSTVAEANRLLDEQKIDLILLDLRLPDGSGLEVLERALDLDQEIAVVVMTAFPDVKTAVRAMKAGARDLVVKPFDLEDLHLTVQRVIEAKELRRQVKRLEHEKRRRGEIREMLGESPAIKHVRDQICKVAPADSPVLIVGETGTGKELVADGIHRVSPRSGGPLVKVNCSAFSEQLLESELFGHEKGAFTDAKQARAGLFEMSEGGSLFLDEISELKPDLQAKLLRVVEGQPFRRVGGQREIQTNVRIIAATNRDLRSRIQKKQFREDLYFRLKVFQIDVPPLRDREEDVVLLGRFFLQRSSAALRKSTIRLMSQAEKLLLAYNWPGNVRELQNVMERAAILCDSGQVDLEHLPKELQVSAFVRRQIAKNPTVLPSLSDIEGLYVEHVLESVDGNLSEAARILGIARNTLKAKLKETVARDS